MSGLDDILGAIAAIAFALVCLYMALQAFWRWKKISRLERGFAVGCLPVVLFGIYALWGVFQSARLKAEDVTCAEHMKQLGLAALMYAEDFDNRVPPSGRWVDRIYSYVKNDEGTKQELFQCPAAPRLDYGYAMNRAMSSENENSVAEPDTTVLIFESDSGGRNAEGSLPDVARTRHFGTSNFCYSDGHVERINGYAVRAPLEGWQGPLVWSPGGK
jgi:prepilin-type processing-associated H-X9-DG protein